MLGMMAMLARWAGREWV